MRHSVREMVAQRVQGLPLGYEDLNDHEQLREDPLLMLLAGSADAESPLAGKSTLNRLEDLNGPASAFATLSIGRGTVQPIYSTSASEHPTARVSACATGLPLNTARIASSRSCTVASGRVFPMSTYLSSIRP